MGDGNWFATMSRLEFLVSVYDRDIGIQSHHEAWDCGFNRVKSGMLVLRCTVGVLVIVHREY